jgi:GxxExxY protein
MLEREGYEIMGAAFEVYNTLGSGFLEEVYQHSLEIELDRRQIPFKPQLGLKLHYKDIPLRKMYVADMITYDSMILELKAVSSLTLDHFAQLMNYLKASRLPVGYLINFGHPIKLEWRRITLE